MPRASGFWNAKPDAGQGRLTKEEAMRLIKRICGRWQDNKGSKYDLSLDEEGTVEVCTTRPSGDVLRTAGLIRIEWRGDVGRVVWGKVGARFLYTIGKLDDTALEWTCSFGTRNTFTWRRLAEGGCVKDQAARERKEPAASVRPMLSYAAVLAKTASGSDSEPSHQEKLEETTVWRSAEVSAPASIKALSEGGTSGSHTTQDEDFRSASEPETVPQASLADADSTEESQNVSAPEIIEVGPVGLRVASEENGFGSPHARFIHPAPDAVPPWLDWEPRHVPSAAWKRPEGSCPDVQPVKRQLEYYFSDANLCHDSNLRSFMTEDGFVCLVLLHAFPRMRALKVDFWMLPPAVKSSKDLELDESSYYVRIRNRTRRLRWLAESPHGNDAERA